MTAATFKQARIDIATQLKAIQTAWSSYELQIETDNRNVINYPTQTNPFLQVDTIYVSGEQLELGKPNALKRQWAQLLLSAVDKDGNGTAATDDLLDFVLPYFDNQDLGNLRFMVGQRQKDRIVNGWCYRPVLFNFYFLR